MGTNKPSLGPLGETEVEVLQHVWDLGAATVAEVHERIRARRKVAYTTIMTVMKKLAAKGYLTFEQQGTAYVYRAARPAHSVKHSLLDGILKKVFQGSPVELVASLVEHEPLSEAERAEIRRLIDELDNPEGPADDA